MLFMHGVSNSSASLSRQIKRTPNNIRQQIAIAMSNPPDPNELLKLLLKQQQENQQRQRLLQQLQSQPQQQQQTYQSPVDAGLLGNLMNYLAAPSTANGGGAPAAASSVLSLLNMQQPQASQQPQQQTQAPSSQLLTLTNILSSMQGQLPQGVSQQQPFHNQGQVSTQDHISFSR